MIESEEKREVLEREIKRWCDHVKATPLLRQGDIEGLVRTILGEFYPVVLSCGHWVAGCEDGVHIAWYDSVFDKKEKAVTSGLYCKDCAEKYKKKLGAWEVGG